MTAADKRVEELLDRWMTSLELHARYLKLDDATYARAEQWPPHQRPTKWIVDVARQRLLELRAQVTQRKAADPTFAEALELMSFLTSLLGSEHIERFIPLATGKAPVGVSDTGTVEQPRPRPSRPRESSGSTAATQRRPTVQQKPAATPARPSTAAQRPTAPKVARDASGTAAAPRDGSRQVIADAVRMLEWGREWPALAGLIARMADRPSEAEVWKILRTHRAEILTKARRPVD